ncbi:hypothetical protein [Nesterenkonia alkaliphila]|uniref:DUF3800 domain-containing protein n=1 Tax=Nesterenkonia alkaliphila TaxID=1463631 RepID=A0A7K1UGY8_9MICC|nr:hypothetical protein [Nesterenkonia alkaliphila]MVT25728.1 hypothetical protein [Nesterenkonia alkaliphila]
MPESGPKTGHSSPVTIFLDEGALDGEFRFPSACAVVVEDVETVQTTIEKTIHELALSQDFRMESTAAEFASRGFHHSQDPLIAKREFIKIIPKLNLDWWCSSHLNPSDDPYSTLDKQFQWVMDRILLKLKSRPVEFVFEQNSKLNRSFRGWVDNSTLRSGYDSSLVSYRIGTKADRVLSVADYCISVSSQAISKWMALCCETSKLPNYFCYRNFALLERSCSVLHPWGMKRSLSSRTSGRLKDRSYFQLTGEHRPTCSRRTAEALDS